MREQQIDTSQAPSQQSVKYRDGQHILKAVINICLASTYSGFVLAYFNTITFDDTVKILDIRSDRAFMQALLSFCISVGAGIGGYLSSLMISSFSRKQCFLYIAYSSIVVTLLLQTKVVWVILICRLVQGVSVGMTSAIRPVYIKQFVPIEMSGKMGSVNQLMFAVGLTSTFVQTYLLSLFCEAEVYWRIVYLTPILFLVVQVFNLKVNFPYETPKYLLEQQRRQEAYQLIRVIYKQEYVEQRIQQLDKIIKMTHQKQLIEPIQTDSQMTDVREHLISKVGYTANNNLGYSFQQQKQEKIETNNLTKQTKITKQAKSNRIAVWCAINLSILQQITGIQIVIIYTGQILLSVAPSLQKILPILIQAQGFVMTFYGMKLLATYGRKQMIQNGCLAMAAFQFCVCLSFLWQNSSQSDSDSIVTLPGLIIIVSLICFRAVFSLTIGPIVWLYLPEIVEPDIISISTMINWFTAAFISFIFPICLQILGPSPIFGIIACLIVVGYMVNQRLMVETKGLAEWQIRKEYDQK